ncbi:MAG: F0F1 ATP synthase subunit delta [Candidatus Accumulibacter sp.]|jgi:F-type H+-transporting ATPase subunit delta|nr:F0F1 ATP synthase subunit delta [Accumulibacter sp.]
MAESVTIARPYAQAVFRLAKGEGDLAAWSERLQRLAAIAADPDMERVTGNPEFSARRVTELFMSLTGEPENRELASFVDLLAENGRFGVLSEISAIYESLKDEDEGVREAAVTSAFPLSDAELAALLQKLAPRFGGRLRGRVKVDPALIGGVVVAVGDRIYDASVRGKLEAMSVALKN